jgi:hypothetical protein
MALKLGAMLKAQSFVGHAIFLFGHCNATEGMADFLLANGVRSVAILDNSKSKQGLNYRGIPIVPPSQVLESSGANHIVLVATRFYAEMHAQLRRLGYEGEIVQVVEFDSFAEYSLSDETFERKIERMERGAKVLEHVRKQFPTRHLVICPNNALGDVYWAMAFLPSYCKKQGINEPAVLVVGNSCFEAANLFVTGSAMALDSTEMDELVQAIIFTGEPNCIIAHHDRPYADNIIRYLDKHFLSFIDYYRCAVYGLAKDAPVTLPTNIARFENAGQIPKGKSVILSPYAKSIVELPRDFWAGLAAEYASKGYSVYTNTIGGELPIEGTETLSVPVSQMASAAEHAGAFVGIRNGLCDVLFHAKCQKTVVFPDCYYSTTPHKVEDFFSLPRWDKIVIRQK